MSDVAARLADLVAINSVNASLLGGPGEQAMADYVAEAARAMGAEVELHEVEPGRPNVLARLDRDRPRTLMFECHLDTVGLAPMPDALKPRIEGGRLYGRGSADPKGSLAAMLSVLEHAASDPAFPVNLWLAGSMDEEITMRGSRALAERRPAVDGVIVGEPTGLQPIVAHKGVLRWRVRTAGVAAQQRDAGARPQRDIRYANGDWGAARGHRAGFGAVGASASRLRDLERGHDPRRRGGQRRAGHL